METKVIKLEIGKVLAIILAIIVVAILAGILIKSAFFKGDIIIQRVVEPLSIEEFDRGVELDSSEVELLEEELEMAEEKKEVPK